MAKRFVFGILAIGLLLMAVFKCSTRKSNGSGIHQSPSASSGQQLTWINKSLVIIKRSQLGQDAQLHDIFLLKQKVDSGESCSVGLFRLIKKNEEKGTLKFIGTRLSSRFEIWAEAQGKRIEWQWQAIKGNDLLAPPEQQCWLWRKDGNVRQQPLVVVERDRFFIRGSQYAEVVEGGRGRFKIDNDHFRRGWWVKPVHPHLNGTLILRNAVTGVLEALPLEFRGKNNKGKSEHLSKIRSREIRKSYALPGWD